MQIHNLDFDHQCYIHVSSISHNYIYTTLKLFGENLFKAWMS